MGLRTAKRKFSASNVKQIDRLSGDLIMDWASIIYSDHIKLSNDFQWLNVIKYLVDVGEEYAVFATTAIVPDFFLTQDNAGACIMGITK